MSKSVSWIMGGIPQSSDAWIDSSMIVAQSRRRISA